jgi:hypothetical protein
MNLASLVCLAVMLVESPSFAQSPYLGTQREHIQAGIAKLRSRELDEERRKKSEPVPKDSPLAGNIPQGVHEREGWEDEVFKLIKPDVSEIIQAENTKKTSTNRIQAPQSLKSKNNATPKEINWKSAGFSGFNGKADKSPEFLIASGSFVSAHLLTGVDAPANASVPVLIRFSRGMIGPNQGFVDLSGCHAIAKATGDLTTERVKLKTTSMSCVSPSGGGIDLEFESYAVGNDSSLGIPGELNSRQGRVAMMAFVNSVIESATSIISNTAGAATLDPFGQHVGMKAGSSAANDVVKWYLEQAKNYFPSVEVFSGSPLKLVLLKPLSFPRQFFASFSNPNRKDDDEAYNIIF